MGDDACTPEGREGIPPSLADSRVLDVRRVRRSGNGLVLPLPEHARRFLGVGLGSLLVLVPQPGPSLALHPLDVVRDGLSEPRGDLRRLAEVSRQNVRLRRRLRSAVDHAFYKFLGLAQLRASRSLDHDLASFLADYRAGRVLVLPVEAEAVRSETTPA